VLLKVTRVRAHSRELEESGGDVMLIESRRSETLDREVPVLHRAGADAAGEFRCVECGYGVIVRTVLPACPMCRGVVWESPGEGLHPV
jgi:hypothetical protein